MYWQCGFLSVNLNIYNMIKSDVPLSNKVSQSGRVKGGFASVELSKPYEAAIWLVNKTALTFDQIAQFCKLHPMDVNAIADGTLGKNLIGCSPVGKYITQQEVQRCEQDCSARLEPMDHVLSALDVKLPKRRKYVSLIQRRSKPDAVLWLVNFHPSLLDRQIGNLVGSTIETVSSIRSGTHRNMASFLPKDPVLLGLCTQEKLDDAVSKAYMRTSKEKSEKIESD